MTKDSHFKILNDIAEEQLKNTVDGKTINVWFNHWFSTAYHYIKHLKDTKVNKFNVLASNIRENTVYFEASDSSMIEPDIDKNSKDYLHFASKVCKDSQIDICFIHHGISNFISNDFKYKFVKPCSLQSYELSNNKIKFLELVKENNLYNNSIKLPEYFKVHTVEDFKYAVNELKNNDICFKPISGIGGIGFNRLHKKEATMKDYLIKYGAHLTANDVQLLLEKNEKNNLIVMKYYSGNEYSIDCFAQNGKLKVCIPRKKIDSRVKILEYNEPLIDFSRKITEILNMNNCFNIQLFQDLNDEKTYYINEINTRISGGAWVSELVGVNFSLLSVLNTLDPHCEIKDITSMAFDTKKYNQVEQPIFMGR